MQVFAKIFAQIFDSSISVDYVVRHVFMDLLVLADRDGVVDMTTDAIARRTNVPEEIVAHAISELMKDDRKSRSHEEGGRRIIPIDSHRDWGWQIVNFEHYRNIKDEEARRTYFRDKKREQRAKSSPTPASPQPSNLVKDITPKSTNVTQGEGNGDLNGNRDVGGKTKIPAKVNLSVRCSDAGSEIGAANWLLEELGVVSDNQTRIVASEAIRLLAKEGGTVQTAAEYILEAGIGAKESGEVITRFWFSDQKYRPQGPRKSERQKRIETWEPSE